VFPALEKFLLDLRDRRMKQLKIRRADELVVIPIQKAKVAMDAACQKANLSHFHHRRRHFFWANAIEFGFDFRTITGGLGHSDGGVLAAQGYGHYCC